MLLREPTRPRSGSPSHPTHSVDDLATCRLWSYPDDQS